MVLSPDFFETLQEIAEQQKQIQKAVNKANLNSPATQVAIPSIQRHKEFLNSLEPLALQTANIQETLDKVSALHLTHTFAALNSISLERYTIPVSTLQAVPTQNTALVGVSHQLANNQAFFNAIEQSASLAKTIDQLAWMGATSYSNKRLEEVEDTPDTVNEGVLESPPSSHLIYDQTVDPYGPFREDVYQTQQLIAAYLLASLVDSGDLSEEISEEQKKRIRFGLAVFIGLAIGATFSLAVAPTLGATLGVGSSALVSSEFDSYYDIKRHQNPYNRDSP